jgi:hypothetical protein
MAVVPLDVVHHGSGHRSRQTQDAQWMRPQVSEPVFAPSASVEGWLIRAHADPHARFWEPLQHTGLEFQTIKKRLQ